MFVADDGEKGKKGFGLHPNMQGTNRCKGKKDCLEISFHPR